MKERRQSFNKWYWENQRATRKKKERKEEEKKRIQTDLISFTKLAKNEPYT